jgi:maltose/moltooligosaccharide transporter
MSDRTWTRLGRRRPYFLVGAILSSIALFVMPTSPVVWMAAGLLWILDASINISMEPFRAFVADKLNMEQRTAGFAMQSFFIGLGASLSSALPYIFGRLGVTGETASGIPYTVKYSFQLGALAFFAAVLWTVLTSAEYPPKDMDEFLRKKQESKKISILEEIFSAIREMPKTMRQLAAVQIFTWLGLFCMWLFFGLTTARHVFGATNPKSDLYNAGIEWGGVCFSVYSIVCFIVAFAIPSLAKATSRKIVHSLALVAAGIGLLSIYFIHNPNTLLLTMVGVGIAWASILSMPYAILSGSLPPEKMGIYMGIFNFFIVIPEIIASLTFQPLVKYAFGNNPLYVVMLGGVCMLVAAGLVSFVEDPGTKYET